MSEGDDYDEDFDYQDDYDEDFGGESSKRHSFNSKPSTAEEKRGNQESDDEQKSQKLESKIAQQQRQIDSLLCMLDDERSDHDKSKSRVASLERELKTVDAANAGAEQKEDSSVEVEELRKENARLKDRLEDALALSPDNDKCPSALCEEFVSFCKKRNIFVAYSADDFVDVSNCIKVLKAEARKKVAGDGDDSASNQGKRGKSSLDTGLNSAPAATSSSNDSSYLHSRIRKMEKELKAAHLAVKNANSLRNKVMSLNERVRNEKEQKYKVEDELKNSNKKIDMLSNHMEKLVIHLKQVGAQKMRIAEQSRSVDKENTKLKEKCDMVSSKSAAKDRLILELREGSKVLEDQLRLMDEKYLELRTKLDYAREMGARRVKKAQKTAADLRVKFIMAGNTVPLDKVQIPEGYNPTSHHNYEKQSFDLVEHDRGFDAHSMDDDMSWHSNSTSGSHKKLQRSLTFSPTRSNSGMDSFAKDESNVKGIGFIPPYMANSPNSRSTIAHPYHPPNAAYSPATDSSTMGKSKSQVRFSRNGAAALDNRSVGSVSSVNSSVTKEPTMDGVLEKIRVQAGNKQDWTTDKARSLLQKNSPGNVDRFKTI